MWLGCALGAPKSLIILNMYSKTLSQVACAAAHLLERLKRVMALDEYQEAVPEIIARPAPQVRVG